MMFINMKKTNRVFLFSLFCVLSFVLILGAANTWAGGKSGCAKACTHKMDKHNCPMMKTSTESEGQKTQAGQALCLQDFSKVEQYTCPMHPQVRTEKSGKCPECGMKLVKGDFYQVYTCAKKECPRPCFSAKPGKCCGKDLQRRVMSKGEYYDLAQLQDEYFCPMHSEVVSDKAGKCPKCGMKLEMRTVQKPQEEPQEMLSYACPMHPDEMSNKPGDCSKCGMKLKEYKTTSK
jgi:hypothetical protein